MTLPSEQITALESRGAELVILGCTELPLGVKDPSDYSIPLLDPMRNLARALIKYAAPDKLKAS